MPTEIWSPQDKEKEEEEKEVILIQSRDPHLAGGEQDIYMCYCVSRASFLWIALWRARERERERERERMRMRVKMRMNIRI